MLTEIRDLYPNCQMYFDVYDNFCFDMKPSLNSDAPDMDDDYLSKVMLASGAESVTYDIPSLKNVNEVFGKTYDIDFFSTVDTSYTSDTYIVDLNSMKMDDGSIVTSEVYTEYAKYDKVAFTPNVDCNDSPKININGLGALPIYEEYTTNPVSAGTIKKDVVCALQIYFYLDENKNKQWCAYFLGEYQPHAICVLTDTEDDPKYTKEYFAKKYNVKEHNVVFRVAPFSPYTVQKLGEIFSTEDHDEILSETICRDNAKYNNYKSSTMFDTVTLTTVLVPWLDVHTKINYTKQQEGVTYSYIIKSISHDFSGCTTSITMFRFQQLYENF